MSSTLPELLDPWRAVELGSELIGRLPLSSLPRLGDSLLDTAGEAELKLVFGRDLQKRGVVTGTVKARLVLRCQRCLDALEHEVDAPVALALVRGMDEAGELPEEYDPLLAADGLLRLADLVEDELILSLPQIPMHEAGQCRAAAIDADDAAGFDGSAERENPFAVLADWRRED
jgi:uncharacterized protein